MESWLPWLIEREQLITDVLPAESELIFVDPKRMRDRAKDLLAEEDDLAKALASTWARDAERTFPRLHLDIDQLFGPSQSLNALSLSLPSEAMSPESLSAVSMSSRLNSSPSFRLSRSWFASFRCSFMPIPKLVDANVVLATIYNLR
jgi:hypothetical protein